MAREQEASSHQAWEGFDGREITFDEKKEKRHEASIWIYLTVFSLVILGIIAHNHVTELLTIRNGTCIEASYSVLGNGNEVATYYDADGKPHFYDISGMNAVHDGATVMLYYMDDINHAITKTPWYERLIHYTFFGLILGVSVWRIRKIYK